MPAGRCGDRSCAVLRIEMMRLTVVVPTYNEASTIENTLQEIGKALGPDLCRETEVLIADDGEDAMPALIERLQGSRTFAKLELMRNSPPVGKGLSLSRAFLGAAGNVVGFLDA